MLAKLVLTRVIGLTLYRQNRYPQLFLKVDFDFLWMLYHRTYLIP